MKPDISLTVILAAISAIQGMADAIAAAYDRLVDDLEDAGEDARTLLDLVEGVWDDITEMLQRDPERMRGRAVDLRAESLDAEFEGDARRAARLDGRAARLDERASRVRGRQLRRGR